ncbi:unnamed protein product (macronuclear) [Paramecium tetraurelia]|uniref:NACHT domain-containing protein n=1 Tax=Paramecium tetraurelia TaxID=5888 RepID=A0CGD7_PARTE|nr:uncharacterized protein GSPATT00007294001 [Paramecium tetraurelia]CAK69854.1 unnamed protein product [Paramecium tetraurelia]|eukprot:XP_001437251.1 hypothetical protein (macronuclear) [Paramecium tetraurelia strain d4-2]
MDDAYSNRPTSPKDKKTTIESMRHENMNYIDRRILQKLVTYTIDFRTASGLDRYFLEIEDWLDEEKSLHQNTPLVLEADDGIGKKTLLVKWMEYHAKNKKGRYQDYIIPHFATQSGKNSNYFFAIYRILIKLRETLNIKQKVELVEEKLRRYFHYWLEICSRELEQQFLNGAKVIYDKVILIFEGIDNFRDMLDVHREANVSFWLPKYFPKNIKVIVTAEKNSNSMRILKPSCHVIPITCDPKVIKIMVNGHFAKQSFLVFFQSIPLVGLKSANNPRVIHPIALQSQELTTLRKELHDNGLVELKDIDIDVVENILKELNLQQIKHFRTVEELFTFQLKFFSESFIFTPKTPELKQDPKFIQLITVLAITQKGLTFKEIQSVCEFEDKQWKLFLLFFKIFLMKHRELWIIHNEIFKKCVINCYHNEKTLQLHDKIAETINKYTNNSIRKLEEETFHLFSAKNYFRLKEVISIIENFLLLFNPNNKYDLCRYWQKLEENGFDPVLEYNKAVEGFQIHYHPSAEDLFRIIIQVSRFLKEFGDFETKNTPVFRHPPIIGVLQDLFDIGLLQEILKLDLYFNKDPELKQFDPAKHLKRVAKAIKTPALTKMESQNVEIQQNRYEVRNHYLKQMIKSSETEPDEQETIQTLDIDEYKYLMQKILQKLLTDKRELLSGEEEITGDRVSSDYYYKRWIWIQFPWACLSISKKCDYSKTIKHCFSSATDYMSVEEEHAYTNSALKIAIEAKLKKKLMYDTEPEEQQQSIILIPQASVLNQPQPVKLEYTFDNSQASRYDRSKAILPRIDSINASSLNMSQEKYERTMFITQDFTDLDTLNQESKGIKITIETRPNDGQNTVKLLDKFKSQKGRLKSFQSSSLSLNAYQQTEIFPILKTDIQKHSQKQLHLLEQQAKQMRKKLDTLTYENLKLAKILKQQKIIDFNKGYIKKELSNLEELKETKIELEKQLQEAEQSYKTSSVQKVRVITILKICKDNKQQNEEYIRHLQQLINNFKKLIRFEEVEIQKNKQQIKILYRTIDDFLITYNQKKKHQGNLINQIRNSLLEKTNLDHLFQAADAYIQDSALESVQNLRRNQAKQNDLQQNKKLKQQQEKNTKTIHEKLELFEKKYAQIKGIFDIKEQNYSHSTNFLDFMANIEKKSELEIQLSEQQQNLEAARQKKIKLEEELLTFQNAYQMNKSQSLSNIEVTENCNLIINIIRKCPITREQHLSSGRLSKKTKRFQSQMPLFL